MAVIRTKKIEKPWTSERIAFAMRGYFSGICMEEINIGNYREDMVFISDSRYVTVCEIKVSLSDWKADFKKHKWKSDLDYRIKNFFFVVPEHLIEKMPEQVPLNVGIIGVKQYHTGYDTPYIHRPAKANKNAVKMSEERISRLYRNHFYRYRELLTKQRAKEFLNKEQQQLMGLY